MIFWYYLAALGIVSVITLALYGFDKLAAIHGFWRIPENVLLLFPVGGGAIGGLIGMQLFRHKTRHWYFYLVNILCIVLQAALAVLLLVKGW